MRVKCASELYLRITLILSVVLSYFSKPYVLCHSETTFTSATFYEIPAVQSPI